MAKFSIDEHFHCWLQKNKKKENTHRIITHCYLSFIIDDDIENKVTSVDSGTGRDRERRINWINGEVQVERED